MLVSVDRLTGGESDKYLTGLVFSTVRFGEGPGELDRDRIVLSERLVEGG
jgi:hypothetical protein